MVIPAWFDEGYYLMSKLKQLQAQEPSANWTQTSLLMALNENGFTPYTHFLHLGTTEGLNPNQWFNMHEYLHAKLQQLATVEPNVSWSEGSLVQAIVNAGMSVWEHFQQHGWREGVNPSNDFDIDGYFNLKLGQLKSTDPGGGWTFQAVVDAFVAAGFDPITHYMGHGRAEGVVPVPVDSASRVPSDPNRLDDNSWYDWGDFDGDLDDIFWGDLGFDDPELEATWGAMMDSLAEQFGALDLEGLSQRIQESGLLDPANLNPDGTGLIDPQPLIDLVMDYFYGTANPLELLGGNLPVGALPDGMAI